MFELHVDQKSPLYHPLKAQLQQTLCRAFPQAANFFCLKARLDNPAALAQLTQEFRSQLPKLLFEEGRHQTMTLDLLTPYAEETLTFLYDFISYHLYPPRRLTPCCCLATNFSFLDPSKSGESRGELHASHQSVRLVENTSKLSSPVLKKPHPLHPSTRGLFTLCSMQLRLGSREETQAVLSKLKKEASLIALGAALPTTRAALFERTNSQDSSKESLKESGRTKTKVRMQRRLYSWILHHPQRVQSHILAWMARMEISGRSEALYHLHFSDLRRLILALDMNQQQVVQKGALVRCWPQTSPDEVEEKKSQEPRFTLHFVCSIPANKLTLHPLCEHLERALALLLPIKFNFLPRFFLHLQTGKPAVHHFVGALTIHSSSPAFPFKIKIRDKLASLLISLLAPQQQDVIMPHNEEEACRFAKELAKELTHDEDIPQLHIQFNNINHEYINYTLIIAAPATQGELFDLRLQPDQRLARYDISNHVEMGTLEKKRRVVTIFNMRLHKTPFVEHDQTVHLVRARQYLYEKVRHQIGAVRDFSGGVISKQMEALKKIYAISSIPIGSSDTFLDHFFFNIQPIVFTLIIAPETILSAWRLIKEVIEQGVEEELCFKKFAREEDLVYLFASTELAQITKLEDALIASTLGRMNGHSRFRACEIYFHVIMMKHPRQETAQEVAQLLINIG